MKTNVFIICSVRNISEEYKKFLEKYVFILEQEENCIVHLPHRDTNQDASGLEICIENMKAIRSADRIDIFYNSKSQGTHFDMGVAFAFGKNIKIVQNEDFGEGKSYPKMLHEWEFYCRVDNKFNTRYKGHETT